MCGYKKLVWILIVTNIIVIRNVTAQTKQEISVRTYGAIPDDNKDDTEALRKAVAYCRRNPGTTLLFPPGIYELKDKAAEQLEADVMSGKFGKNPEKIIYTPYYPYTKGLDFSGAEDLTVKAEGATLLCQGWMEPVSFDGCRNIRLSGLTIDYKRQPYSYGTVTGVGDTYFDVQFTSDRKMNEAMPYLRATFWMKDKNRLYPDAYYFLSAEILGNNLVRFRKKIPKQLEGSIMGIIHSFHFRPAILVLNSEDVLIKEVTIHSQPGMGIVGFDSKNIVLEQIAVVPAPGKYFSTNTDATHFACCEGLIRFNGCRFQGQGDDATNVHGYYQTITDAQNNKASIKVMARTFTHAQVLDAPRPGDTLELVEIKTLRPVKKYVVKTVTPRITDFESDVILSDALPGDFADYYLMNITKLPKVEFENSFINSHLARGILIKTRNVLINNNLFRHCTGTAIHVGAEAEWHEGSHAKNVKITNNIIIGCGSGDGKIEDASGIAVVIEAENRENVYLHENIHIEGNTIIGENNPYGIYLSNAKQIKLENNVIQNCVEQIKLNNIKETVLTR